MADVVAIKIVFLFFMNSMTLLLKRRLIFLLFISLSCHNYIAAQETFPVNGIHDHKHLVYVFKNVRIFVSYNMVVENATMLVQDGIVKEVGSAVPVPSGAVEYDLTGKTIYPSFIDVYSIYGMPEIKNSTNMHRGPQMERKIKSAYGWNEAVKSEVNAAALFKTDTKAAGELRKLGFGAVSSLSKDGIARGSSVLVALGDGNENELILKEQSAVHYSFSKGTSKQSYPSSTMGSIALLRQTYLDAEWYKKEKSKKEINLSLDAWNNLQNLPQIFESSNKLDVLRADNIGDEFGVQYIIKTGGDDYQRIEEIKASGAPCILTLNFPKPYDVQDPYMALNVTLAQMKHWEMAPANPAVFEKNNIPFALTLSDLNDPKDFWKNLRKAIQYGISETTALKALTAAPAAMLGIEDKLGALRKGMVANFIITSGNLFDKKTTIYENWVQGTPYIIHDYNILDIRGSYTLKVDTNSYNLDIGGTASDLEANIKINDSTKIKVETTISEKTISMNFTLKEAGIKGTIRLIGTINKDNWKGNGQLPDGNWIEWEAVGKAGFKEDSVKKDTKKDSLDLGQVYFPNMAYGWKDRPKEEKVLIKNATVWTNEKEGVLKETDVLIKNGKIAAIGKNLPAEGVRILDATGMHLTPGIIDEHSHIAISSGVNEGSQAISAEVRIGDVINSDDIAIYRQLAGGVTGAQLLHGSANPIGGQSALIKLRWGLAPEKMKIKGADEFIKFALGENVKQSNWGDDYTVRYPQSRMGVEQVLYNAFIRAREYQAGWTKFNALSDKQKKTASIPRKDLELQALAEILETKRFITCHSYTQSEINMLLHLADSMKFRVNTFTHILEGYKVADKLKAHSSGASTFSDWWAYKYEVIDAIPYNGAILTEMGVVTAYNSDDAEMGRRLNQEAAKAVKYGNITEEEALKLVTLNPAKLLHLDDKMGSIKPGKDADIVLWTDNPLSIYAKVDKTFVDGVIYFDALKDREMREEIKKERARLIQKMIKAKKDGDQPQTPKKETPEYYKCEVN